MTLLVLHEARLLFALGLLSPDGETRARSAAVRAKEQIGSEPM
jgi:hypothetical protein